MLDFTKRQHTIIIIFAVVLIIGSGIQLFLYLENKKNAQVVIPEEMNNLQLQGESKVKEREDIEEQAEIYIHITGAVKMPGMYKMVEGSRVNDAINTAGGATLKADLEQINLAEKLKDEEKIYVPQKGEIGKSKSVTINKSLNQGTNKKSGITLAYQESNSVGKSQTEKVDLNSASEEQIDGLPGIGPSIAKRVIEYRTQHGRFTSVEELNNVKGIGESKLSKILPMVEVR